jgi:NADH-quinone oxidoreductase subunit L
MFVAMGVGAYSVGMFHLFTHAFFKALLFLGAGSVITALHHEQDIRRMGGLRKALPVTYAMMLIGTLSLTGFPLTAGFFSKDAIIEAAYAGHNFFAPYAFWLTLIAVALTAFYSWRLVFVAFHGHSRVDPHVIEHAHESPPVMTIPLGVLAFGAIVAGLAAKGIFTGEGVEHFFRESIFSKDGHKILEEMHHAPFWVTWAPTLMMVLGFAVAYWFYIHDPSIPRELARRNDILYRFLLNKWYFDEIYDFLLVRPAKWLGYALWKRGDGWLIDGFGPDGVAARVLDVTRNTIRLQTGYLYHYAFVMLVGVALLISWFLVRGAG